MIWDLIFPKSCLGCKKPGEYICETCFAQVHLGGWRGNNYSVFKYEGVIRKAIIALKYKFATDIAEELVERVVGVVKEKSVFKNIQKPILVPIPLHQKRLNWRGFNQSEVLGEKIAQQMKWEFISDLLIRTKPTKPQVELKGYERHKNLIGVFSVNPKYLKYKNRNIILFDDVYTTGSTVSEAHTVLFKNGFRRVFDLTIAA